ncbi:glycosyl hydrolase [Cesiribacter sp. SM1]|uniref:glycosyl hydrolase n=1 Tax=Cesiribacter sp. SM1 TaxID=2861196 RepID=UPI001CD6525B|nr:glycosyl hydrolase [Cesiribacter sp. SM1]
MSIARTSSLVLMAAGTLFFSHCSTQPESTTALASLEENQEVWPPVKEETKPWTRWWWMGSAVDEKNVSNLLEQYAKAGIGGVEIAPIYGAMGYEDRYLQYLSPQWMQMLNYTVQKADSLSMGVDLTLGTGWPFGGPHVSPAQSASQLVVQKYKLSAGKKLQEKLELKDPKQAALNPQLQAVVAYGKVGEVLQLTDKVTADGRLNWTPAGGEWEVYAAFASHTRQQVKRAAPGGEGYTLDHLSSAAVQHYLTRFDQAFGEKTMGIRAFYNDSYEVYGANWSPAFFEEFKQRRGYDLRPYLRALLSEEKSETVARVKADYRETMGEMLLENFTAPWTTWAHAYKGMTKNQAHGSPGNLLDLYAAVDIPEAETFGSSYFPVPGLRRDSADIRNVDPDPVMLKFASSAANVQGKPLASSETFTWLGEHFKTSYSQMKPELEQVFLSGINHVFYHGVTYSPEDVAWPGWLFYASLNLTPANSLWPHFKGINEYITRCQSVLQAGTSDNELLVYWPVYDVYHNPDGLEKMIKVHDIDEWLHPSPFYRQVEQLMEKGYSLDFASDKMLLNSRAEAGNIQTAESAAPYKVLLVPQSSYMPLQTLQGILKLAEEGATVVFEQLPQDVPGMHELEARRQQLKQTLASLAFTKSGSGMQLAKTGKGQVVVAPDVLEALQQQQLQPETLVETGLKFIRRNIEGGKFYYLVNHTPRSVDTEIPLTTAAQSVVILDPQTGTWGLGASSLSGNSTQVRVQMAPGEALILKAMQAPGTGMQRWIYLGEASEPMLTAGSWKLEFTEGGPALPAPKQLKQLQSWTNLQDKQAEAFSGAALYSTTFNLPQKEAGEYILNLGEVRESARVWINGEEVGLLWSIPYKARVGQYLKEGENTLKVEVVNLMANRIRDMDQKGIEWRRYHEINFVNINYKPFDASAWEPVPSGLLGPVTLTHHSAQEKFVKQ